MIKINWTGNGQPKLFFSTTPDLKPTWTQFNSPNLLLEVGFETLKSSNATKDNAGFGAVSVFLPIHKILEYTQIKTQVAGINFLNGASTSWIKMSTTNAIPNLSSCAWNNDKTMLFHGQLEISALRNVDITEDNAEYAYSEVKKIINIDTIMTKIAAKVGVTTANAIKPHLVIITTLSSSGSAYYSANTNFVNALYAKNDNPNLIKQKRPLYAFVESNYPLYAFIKPCTYPSPNNSNYIDTISFNSNVIPRPYTNNGFLAQDLTLFYKTHKNKTYLIRENEKQILKSDIAFKSPVTIKKLAVMGEEICTLGKFKELLKDIK
ncbi:hypothetical protein, partial [Helicobacter rodentium]|uniref:hypothetical protein n=4 Tax=Helicobacter TaxID=209 RepID=UPI00261354D8